MNLLVQSLRAVFGLADDTVVLEATNESGVVEQTRVSLRQTELWLTRRHLVRIDDGLERATTLKKLSVR
jgi:hypothetical protein